MKVLEGLYYSKDHEWVKVEGDKGYVGISDHAQHSLGEIVYVDLPEVGAELTAGDAFGAVESVKAASDLLAPVSGEVVEVNEALGDEPSLVNVNAYENWMLVVSISDKSELEALMTAGEYEEYCSKEA